MDDPTRKELTAWLEFYRELGIEDLYRRAPGSVGMPASVNAAAIAPAAAAPVPRQNYSVAPPPRTTTPTELSKPVPAPRVVPPPVVIKPPTPSFNLFEAAPAPRGPETLAQIRTDLGDCQRCKLAGTRQTIVFGDGNPHAELVFVGEGPGADEDEQGLPFVGRAGKLLNKMIQSIDMKREEVYICNIVKCRPPGNRTPETDEVDACSPFLYRQIETIKPRLVCCLGAPAVRTVLGIKEGITKIHGQFYAFGTTQAIATVHPAYVLRNPREEKILREDFDKIREFLKGG